MAMQPMFSAHKAWEDWASMALGLVIVISPWLAQTPGTQVATVNAMTIGALVIFIGALELQFVRRWEEWCEFALGVWLVISPWVLGYSGLGTLTAMPRDPWRAGRRAGVAGTMAGWGADRPGRLTARITSAANGHGRFRHDRFFAG
jgi:hypothetical protein